ncbi:hypothetical protein L484_011093 [Morus notabilis]|uniref:Uncharacterized protein n=1 Tax=Morus notabilis TaxID=981085 RepID=W9QQ62_9ROSA|nr:hypothetical protein L484_011093 [Morus notabilis]
MVWILNFYFLPVSFIKISPGSPGLALNPRKRAGKNIRSHFAATHFQFQKNFQLSLEVIILISNQLQN